MSSTPFTCLTCRVAFEDADIQRAHYKTDWHRYNLKRKVAQLPPVNAKNFADRVKAQKEQEAEDEAEDTGHCKFCNKHFNSQNAYENHLKSKKHKEIQAKQQQKLTAEQEKLLAKQAEKGLIPMDTVNVSEKNVKNSTTKTSVTKGAPGASSSKQQGPEEDMETDDESVESWNGEALGLEECLFCSLVSDSLDNNMSHMASSHSFFIPDLEYVTDMEGLVLYLGEKVGDGNMCLWCSGKSYSSTKAVQQHMTDKGHCKMRFEGDALTEYADFYDYRKSYPDYVPGEAEENEEDEELEEDVVEEDNFALVLPSGASIGHRSLQRYYNQNLRPERSSALTPVNKLMSQYRALGWTGSSGVVAEKRAKDIAFVRRHRQKYQMRLSCKANKLVKHMRPQVVF